MAKTLTRNCMLIVASRVAIGYLKNSTVNNSLSDVDIDIIIRLSIGLEI